MALASEREIGLVNGLDQLDGGTWSPDGSDVQSLSVRSVFCSVTHSFIVLRA